MLSTRNAMVGTSSSTVSSSSSETQDVSTVTSTVTGGGHVDVATGAAALVSFVEIGGYDAVSSGGQASSTALTSDASATGVTDLAVLVFNGGRAVSSGGTASASPADGSATNTPI